MRRPLRNLQLLLAMACLGGCSDARAPTAPPPARDRMAAPTAPTADYVPAQAWRSRTKPAKTVLPPDPTAETWRVLVHQQVPMQARTPLWQPLPATDNVHVQMHTDARFRCLVTPLAVTAESDDFGSELEGWVLERELRCSSDGWRSWQSYAHQVRVAPDGTRQSLPTRALLRERAGANDGQPRAHRTLVLLRDDAEKRQATTGPPRILARVQSDDD